LRRHVRLRPVKMSSHGHKAKALRPNFGRVGSHARCIDEEFTVRSEDAAGNVA